MTKSIDKQIDRLEIEKVLQTKFRDVAFISNATLINMDRLAKFAKSNSNILFSILEATDVEATMRRLAYERDIDDILLSSIVDFFVRVAAYITRKENGEEEGDELW